MAFICRQAESLVLNPKTQEVYPANHKRCWSTLDLAWADQPSMSHSQEQWGMSAFCRWSFPRERAEKGLG